MPILGSSSRMGIDIFYTCLYCPVTMFWCVLQIISDWNCHLATHWAMMLYLVLFMDHDSDKFSFVCLVWSMTWTCWCFLCRFVLLDHAGLGCCIVDPIRHDSMFS